MEALLKSWGRPVEGSLTIQSALPIGKGMASSSADMVASLRAVAAFYHRRLEPPDIAQLCCAIEPTDGIMFHGVVAFDPRRGRLLERLGPYPRITIIGALGWGRINTEDHHLRRDGYSTHHEGRLREALSLARVGLAKRHVEIVGQAGRLSAEIEWERNGDPSIKALLEISEKESAGVIIAHSGTVRGLLVPASTPRASCRRLEHRLSSLRVGPVFRIPVIAPRVDSLSGDGGWIQGEYGFPGG